MNEAHATLDRLEMRIEEQSARIDALYKLLELRGSKPRATNAGRGDALFDDPPESLDPSGRWNKRPNPTGRRRARFRLGNATGV